MYADVTGLILAGGESVRFGSDKARHVVQGREMIRHVYDAVSRVASEVLIGVGRTGRTFDLPARHVADEVHDAGPLAGLHAGLLAATGPWLLVVACDLPFVTPEVLRVLLAARSPDAPAVVATTPDGRSHPLCAAYHRSILPVVTERLSAHRYAVHGMVEQLRSVCHVAMPGDALRNVNRRSDLTDVAAPTRRAGD